MKGIDIFCASQASTAICLSMQQDQASSSSTSIHLGGRAIDRHNPIIRDTKRLSRALPSAPCSSEPPPINPKPYNQLPKLNNTKKTLSSSSANKKSSADKKKKSSSKPLTDHTNKNPSSSNDVAIYKDCYTAMPPDIKKKSLAQLGDFITPPGSSRYLLSDDAAFFDGLSDYDQVLALVPDTEPKKSLALINEDNSSPSKSSSSSISEKPPSNQVVILRVSLHCKGCEGKVRKHLSRMKGVTSFNIDFAAKKVTVVGDVTPLSVLATISKVKNAQFWPVAAAAATTSSTSAPVPVNKL